MEQEFTNFEILYNQANQKIQSNISQLSEGKTTQKNKGIFFGTFSDAVEVLRKSFKEGNQSKILTDIPELDQLTNGGLRKGQLWVIGARPGSGKTTFAINLLKSLSEYHRAKQDNNKVLFISLEMTVNEIFKKFISMSLFWDNLRVEQFLLKYFGIHPTSNTMESIGISTGTMNKFFDTLQNNYFYLSDFENETNLEELELFISEAVAKNNIKAVIIDYFQLIGVEGTEFGTRAERLASISRALKRLAKKLNISIILLSQLSRDFEKKGVGTVPTLADLRETGSLEQDADLVAFLYENKDQAVKNKLNPDIKNLNVYIAKNRNGSINEFNLMFLPQYAAMKTQAQKETATTKKNLKIKEVVKTEEISLKKEVAEIKQQAFQNLVQEVNKNLEITNNDNSDFNKSSLINEKHELDFLDLDTDVEDNGEVEFYDN